MCCEQFTGVCFLVYARSVAESSNSSLYDQLICDPERHSLPWLIYKDHIMQWSSWMWHSLDVYRSVQPPTMVIHKPVPVCPYGTASLKPLPPVQISNPPTPFWSWILSLIYHFTLCMMITLLSLARSHFCASFDELCQISKSRQHEREREKNFLKKFLFHQIHTMCECYRQTRSCS